MFKSVAKHFDTSAVAIKGKKGCFQTNTYINADMKFIDLMPVFDICGVKKCLQ